MFRLLLQLALIGGGIAIGASHLDDSAMNRIQEVLRSLGLGRSLTQITDSAPEADEGSKKHRRPASVDEPLPESPRRAFYNVPPEGCHWEKVIDPSDGSVRCSIPERRTNQDR